MKKRYVFVVVVAILIGSIVIAYAHNKQIKAHYIETQENESICILSIILTIIKYESDRFP